MLDIVRKREYFDWLDKGIADQKDLTPYGIQNGWLASFLLDRRDLSVLQIGSKQTKILQILSANNECWGTEDISTGNITQEATVDKDKVKIISTSIENLDKTLPHNHFDVVFSTTFVTHLSGFKLANFLRNCNSFLKPGGIVLHSDILYVGSEPRTIQSIDICRKTLESLNFEWFASPKIDDKLVFDCSFASNPDLTMYRWNQVSPKLRETRESTQGVVLTIVGFKGPVSNSGVDLAIDLKALRDESEHLKQRERYSVSADLSTPTLGIRRLDSKDFTDSFEVKLDNTKAFVAKEHFDYQQNKEVIKKLMKASLRRFHVEVTAYCNRQCGFCPNSDGSRLGNRERLSEGVFIRVLSDLSEIEYDKVFGFHQYNEPLADRIILLRLSQAREYLPKASLSIVSNGDYLNQDYLKELEAAGLDQLSISIYGPNNGEFIDSYIQNKMDSLARKLGLEFHILEEKTGKFYSRKSIFQSLTIYMKASNYWISGYNRGELVEAGAQIKRASPCFYPFQDFTVDWRGNVLPCCNIYPDSPEHQEWVIGNLHDGRSIYEHYANSKLVDWRKNLIRFFPGDSPCKSCTRFDSQSIATSDNVAIMNQFTDRMFL